jgi:hypothetical protein
MAWSPQARAAAAAARKNRRSSGAFAASKVKRAKRREESAITKAWKAKPKGNLTMAAQKHIAERTTRHYEARSAAERVGATKGVTWKADTQRRRKAVSASLKKKPARKRKAS